MGVGGGGSVGTSFQRQTDTLQAGLYDGVQILEIRILVDSCGMGLPIIFMTPRQVTASTTDAIAAGISRGRGVRLFQAGRRTEVDRG